MPSTLNAASNGICPAALGSSSLDYIHFTEEENRGSEQLSDRVPGHMPHTAHSLLHGRGGIWRSSIGKESACNLGDLGLIPGLGRSPGEWRGYPLQYSHLGNSMDCSPPGPSVPGILQARLPEWGAIAFSRCCAYWFLI